MSAFLPRSPQPAQQILVDQLREGIVSRLVLLAIEGAPPETLAALSKTMAGELRIDPAFGIISNGDEAAFARDRDVLWRNRYLLSPAVAPEHFTPAALHAALEADVRLLGSELGMLAKRSIAADPTGEMLRLIGAFSAQAHPAMHDGVWVSPDKTPCAADGPDRCSRLRYRCAGTGPPPDRDRICLRPAACLCRGPAGRRPGQADRNRPAGVCRADARAHEVGRGAAVADRRRIGLGHPAVRLSLRAHAGACAPAGG